MLPSPKSRHYRPGQYLFHESSPSQSLFIIKRGTVSIRKKKGNSFIELAKVHSNEIIGELSFFDRLPRSASAVAIAEVEVLEIEFGSLDKIYKKVPDYFKAIINSIVSRLRRADDIIRKLQKENQADALDQAEDNPYTSASAALAAISGDAGGPIEGAEELSEPSTDDDTTPEPSEDPAD